jgi:hypothetical protein
LPTAELKEIIHGFGHKNVQSTHHTTLEFTKETNLSRNGDCVLVVSVDKGLIDLSAQFKTALKKVHAELMVKIEADGISEEIHAQGSPNLDLSHPSEMVLRKSEFVSNRTLGIKADKAAGDLSRELVEILKNPKQQAKITLTVHV